MHETKRYYNEIAKDFTGFATLSESSPQSQPSKRVVICVARYLCFVFLRLFTILVYIFEQEGKFNTLPLSHLFEPGRVKNEIHL